MRDEVEVGLGDVFGEVFFGDYFWDSCFLFEGAVVLEGQFEGTNMMLGGDDTYV